MIEQLGVGEQAHREAVAEDLLCVTSTLKEELDFVIAGNLWQIGMGIHYCIVSNFPLNTSYQDKPGVRYQAEVKHS